MKNKIVATFLFTLFVVAGVGSLHYLPPMQIADKPLRKVDLLADIRPEKAVMSVDTDTVVLPPVIKPAFVDTCKAGMTCIEDYSDSTGCGGMSLFYEALSNRASLERPVRIAYFGDSFIEADIMTGDLRAMLQEHFGGCGVGYVPITSSVFGFRPTVRHSFSGWNSHAITDSVGFNRSFQDISNQYFVPRMGAEVTLSGQRKYASHLDTCEVSSIYFLSTDSLRLTACINRSKVTSYSFQGDTLMQSVSVKGRIGQVRWKIEQADSASLFYAVTMDPEKGIVLDNFSTRGSSGQQLGHIPLSRLQDYNRLRTYDLIILQYGLNVAFEQGVNYTYYKNAMIPVVKRLKKAFPNAAILIIGVGDREYKDEQGELRTMPGVKNLIRYQQALAAETQVAFWNLFEAMGGEGSMVEMVESKPSMANYDYTHINFRGGKHLASLLFETLIYGKEQYDKRKAYDAK